jgi:hypothetical protein
MALCRSVIKDNNVFMSYMWIHILISDDYEPDILNSDSDVPTTPPLKKF